MAMTISRPRSLRWIWLAFAIVGLAGAGLARPVTQARGDKAAEAVTLEAVQSVLGKANEMASGAVDISQGTDELIIAYQYYDVDMENFESDFATEMAPRIQALYKKFKTIDRVHFQVTANNPTTDEWRPFVEFVLDRKTVEEIHWTGFLARYLLDLAVRRRLT
jgi:ABC-type Fe3+ transport system substrate-binding protein